MWQTMKVTTNEMAEKEEGYFERAMNQGWSRKQCMDCDEWRSYCHGFHFTRN